MKRIVMFILGLQLLSNIAFAADVRGGWTATTKQSKPGHVHVNLVRDHSNNGQTFAISDFFGLTEAQITSGLHSPAVFELRREAGTVAFDGVFKAGAGGGQFSFTPNRAYASTLRGLGLQLDARKNDPDGDEDVQLFQLAILDVSTDFIRSMQSAGYRVSLEKYIALRIFKVTPQLIAEFRTLGMNLDVDDLVAAQIHKVTPAYVREMRAAGYTKADFDDLVATRIHKATPEFISRMRALGYGNLDLDEYVAFRVHQVTPEFVEELAKLGYRNIAADDLVAMRIHKVTPEFIRSLEAEGYRNVPISKLVSMRIHGIDAKFMKKMSEQ